MRHTVHKVFLSTQYEKEEQWINEMSAKGLALIAVGFFKYIFEDETPGKYSYKLELLNKLPSSVESNSYLTFLEDTGIKHIGSIFWWVYLRKRTEDGPFDLYSDIASKLKYLRRLRIFFIMLTILEFVVGFQNIMIGTFYYNHIRLLNITMGTILLILGILLAIAAYTHTKKIQVLRLESRIRE
jgi:Protein of unknown function (DUF2812).